jgi:capsular exopolysaccharide synthesis family protein
MPATTSHKHPEENKIDFRLYLGIVLFRWQMIALCFLWCLLGGVLYIHLAPKKFAATCNIMIYRDPLLTMRQERPGAEWTALQPHTYMLKNDKLHNRVIDSLIDDWAERVGGRRHMLPAVSVRQGRGVNPLVHVRVEARNRDYASAFLEKLIAEHHVEWESVQRQARDAASLILEDELQKLAEQIRSAEDDIIEYQRLHDIARVEAKGSMESQYLMGLMTRKNQLTTEMMMLEAQFPALAEDNAAVIGAVRDLTRATGDVQPIGEAEGIGNETAQRLASTDRQTSSERELQGFQDLRVRLLRLEQEETEQRAVLKEDHPKLRELRDNIKGIKEQLAAAAEVQFQRLKDRQRALKIQLDALESAEYKWQSKNLMASLRQAEYKRLAKVVARFEAHYNTLYGRLHDMRVSEELKAEHFKPDTIASPLTPVWPDPLKILMVALVAGLGSGFGLAFFLQVVDNKIQSIKDVEAVLGIRFLGGVPYWAHSGLESAIRPIVTEEHSTGAIEAYRALRTSVLAEMQKLHEKILIITSADSREGKTLTALNMSIMIAQMDKRVLLIDMDLRRGRLHRSLGLERDPGVTDVLREQGSLKDVIQASRFPNLFFAPSGSSIEDSAELLQSSDIVGMLVDVQDDYDFIMIDTSPVLRVTDTVILATQGMGQVLYVARVNHTPKPMIRYSLDMLRDANILGLVMNSIEMHKVSSLYYAYQYPNYAYYSNAYTYGYNYYYYDDKSHGNGPKHGQRRPSVHTRIQRAGRWFRKNFLPME